MTMQANELISIIIPAFNESENIPLVYKSLTNELNNFNLEIIFIDDGSTDTTLNEIKKLAETTKQIKYLSFSRNFGHQKALMAGLNCAKGNAVISMDADLQHPVKVIPELIKKWKQGNDIVYTIRKDDGIGFFKRLTAKCFYKLMNYISDITIEAGTADFRLLDKKVVRELKNLKEQYIFYRCIIPWVGYKSIGVEFVADKRKYGKSKYTFKRMLNFALDGILSFSTKPLRISIYAGIVIALLSFLYGIYAIYTTAFTNNAVSGWGSTISVILFIGGFQLIVLGIIGEYLGKLYIENKNRPNYIIRETNIE